MSSWVKRSCSSWHSGHVWYEPEPVHVHSEHVQYSVVLLPLPCNTYTPAHVHMHTFMTCCNARNGGIVVLWNGNFTSIWRHQVYSCQVTETQQVWVWCWLSCYCTHLFTYYNYFFTVTSHLRRSLPQFPQLTPLSNSSDFTTM